MAYLTNYNYRTMNCGRGSAEIVTIVGTSKFQGSLSKVASEPRPWRHEDDRHLPALLVRTPDDPAVIAVLIDGDIVGYLTQEVADSHRGQLDELESNGLHLVCSALIVGGSEGKKLGVRLQIKPGIGRRWAASTELAAKPANGY